MLFKTTRLDEITKRVNTDRKKESCATPVFIYKLGDEEESAKDTEKWP